MPLQLPDGCLHQLRRLRDAAKDLFDYPKGLQTMHLLHKMVAPSSSALSNIRSKESSSLTIIQALIDLPPELSSVGSEGSGLGCGRALLAL